MGKVIMAPQDVDAYRTVIRDRIEAGLLAKDIAVPWIGQLYTMKGAFIGSSLVIDSTELVRKTSGLEPSFRNWLFVDDAWKETLYLTIAAFYIGVAAHIATADTSKIQYRYNRYYLNAESKYELIDQMVTMDLTAYVNSQRL